MEVSFSFPWEVRLIEWMQSVASPFVCALASLFTQFGEDLILIGILGYIYWCYDKEWGKRIGTTAVCTLLVLPLVKNFVLRRRPYMDHASIRCLRAPFPDEDAYDMAVQGYSFPSMHTSNAVCTYGTLALCARRRTVTVISVGLILLIGLSRIMLGVHYPTDVLAGYAIGGIMLLLTDSLRKKIRSYPVLMAIFAFLTLPGWWVCRSDDFFAAYGLMIGCFAAFWAEETFVRFENTTNIFRNALRLIGGIAAFFLLDRGLKLAFSLVPASMTLSHILRAGRYAITSFVTVGLYPLTFRKTKRALTK